MGLSPPHFNNFINSYLGNRSQLCYANEHLSNSRNINYGVPQGSILGPLLFLVYINDFPNCVHTSSVRMFADDTTLTACGKSLSGIESKINSDF